MSEEEPAQLPFSIAPTVTEEQSEKVEGVGGVDVIPCLEHAVVVVFLKTKRMPLRMIGTITLLMH
jgi:hypothetical protein